MRFQAQPGDTFLFHELWEDRHHLWVVVTEPHGTPPRIIIVSFTTLRPHSDTTVTLSPGDHPFIRHATAVNFKDARPIDREALRRRVNEGYFPAKQPLDSIVLERIQIGICQSPYTPNRIRKLCRRDFHDLL